MSLRTFYNEFVEALGRTPMVRVKISDPEAPWYPFSEQFHLGDIVEDLNGGSLTRGKIIDAEYEGHPKERKGGSYSVTYTVELENGSYYHAREFELKKIDNYHP